VVPGRAPGAGSGGHVDFPLTNLALHRSREASVLIMASVAENLAAAEARIKADALVSARSEAVATASDSRSIDLLVTVGDRVE